MRNTKQRDLIINILTKAKKPLSANELLVRAKEKQPNIALTTIYRNLDALYSCDLIVRQRFDEKEYCYEIKKTEHSHYLVCKKCKKKIVLPECPLETLESSIMKETGFHVISHNLELEGYCGDCEKNT